MPLFGFGRAKGPVLAPAYANLRRMILTLDPRRTGMQPTPDLPNAWGVVVDWGTGTGIATFVALADGTGSMYTSTGSGTIGGVGQPTIVEAARRLLLAAEAWHGQLDRAAEFGPPDVHRCTYWVLTNGGARTATHDSSGPPPGDAPLNALGEAFQGYVTAFRLLDEAERDPTT